MSEETHSASELYRKPPSNQDAKNAPGSTVTPSETLVVPSAERQPSRELDPAVEKHMRFVVTLLEQIIRDWMERHPEIVEQRLAETHGK